MRYLLDVNALIAIGITRHEFHGRASTWIASLSANGTPKLSTCSISELGFVRIVSQIAAYNVTFEQAKTQLDILKASTEYSFTFLNDDHDVTRLPSWVKSSKHTTDGHLLELAKAKGCVLATFDERISGAFLIPKQRRIMFGDYSPLYGSMGFVRKSERKSGLTKKKKTPQFFAG